MSEEGVSTEWVPLAGMIKSLRAEIQEAHRAGAGEEITFHIGPIELDFDIGVTKGGEGDVGIRFWVVSLGAKGSYEKVQTQHIKLTLTPQNSDGTDVSVATAGQVDPDQVPDRIRPAAPSYAAAPIDPSQIPPLP